MTAKTALSVRGGWDGHQPVAATDLFVPFLRENDYEVRIEESPAVYADAETMSATDLIVQCVTMSTIERDSGAGAYSKKGAAVSGTLTMLSLCRLSRG